MRRSDSVNDLPADKVGHVATAAVIPRNDQPQGAVPSTWSKLAVSVGIGDQIRLIAEWGDNFAKRYERMVTIAAGRDHAPTSPPRVIGENV